MKRLLCLFIGITLLLSASGYLNLHDFTDSSSVPEISEPKIPVEDTLIQGLDNKDADLIKSVFSKRAVSVCKDLDEGIQYMFDIYEGSFEKIVYQNTSTTNHYEEDLVVTEAEPIYVLKTTSDKYYKLRYTVWKSNDPDRETNGVYSIYFYECEADSKGAGGGPWIAGIDHPKRDGVDNAIDTIIYSFTRSDPSALKEAIADNVLNKDNGYKNLSDYITGKGRLSWNGLGDARTNITEDKAEGYLLLNTHPKQCVYVNVRDDKIIALKITELEEGKSLDDYDLTISEPGIVLP